MVGGYRGGKNAASGTDPGARPAAGDKAHHDQDNEGNRSVEDEPPTIGAGVLLGLAEKVGKDATSESTDLADHAASDSGGEAPAKGNKLKSRSVASAEGGEQSIKSSVVPSRGGVVIRP